MFYFTQFFKYQRKHWEQVVRWGLRTRNSVLLFQTAARTQDGDEPNSVKNYNRNKG